MNFGFSNPGFAKDVLHINTGDAAPLHKSDRSGFIDRILIEAFKRVNVEIIINKLPAERSLHNANAGIDDGDSDRIAGLEKIYPNLIAVPEKIMDWEFVAFSKQKDVQLLNWEGLKGFGVTYITGWKIFEKNSRNSATVVSVDNIGQLFSLIENDRADIALYEKWQGKAYVKQTNLSDVSVVGSVLAHKEKFLYLHKKHKKLIPLLAQALVSMKSDGTYHSIYQTTLQSMLKN